MAIPSTPVNLDVQVGNRKSLVSWNLSGGALSYDIARSTDSVNFSVIASVGVTGEYVDSSVLVNVKYWYKVRAVNGDGTSLYTDSVSCIVRPTGELSLGEMRLRSQQRADRVNSQFVDTNEWNFFINQSLFELYNLLITEYEDYFVADPVTFDSGGAVNGLYPLPNGVDTFINSNTGLPFVAPPMFKLMGVDLAINNSGTGWVRMNRFNFSDRNRYVYPNSNSTLYGVNNIRYNVLGDNIALIPNPTSGQTLRLWYIPKMTELLQDTDTTIQGISGWLQYVIVRAAKYALDKEESDTSKLDQELQFLKKTIEEDAMNRDVGMPHTVSDVRGPYDSQVGGDWFKAGI